MHLARFTKGLDLPAEQIQKAQLGLGHAFSRNKMQFDPNRQVQAVQLQTTERDSSQLLAS